MLKKAPWVTVPALLSLAAAPAAAQIAPDPEGFVFAPPEAMVPPERGREIRVLGNPNEPGFYVFRVVWEPGQGSRPHFHDQARLITVLEGTWHVSTGAAADVYDPENMRVVPEGSFLFQPADGHHYDMAKDERVVIQISGIGPVNTTSIPQAEP
jgi:quercetin dioxygenase-like cupin family protein